MEVKCQADDAYSDSIRLYLIREFPAISLTEKADTVDLITDAIVGTGQVRNGPRPRAETVVRLHQIIGAYHDLELPIPFVVLWGSEKPNWTGIDVAELGALKTLKCLNDRVKTIYSQGIVANIRLEDASAPHLFFDNKEQSRAGAKLYCDGLANLNKILELDRFVNPVKESDSYTEETFSAAADKVLQPICDAIQWPEQGHPDALKAIGWRGTITKAAIDYYVEGSYRKLYPTDDRKTREERLARYWAGSLARAKLGFTGGSELWNGHWITLSFLNPAASDRERTDRIFYKTMPSSITSTHIPPWRAKGYLKINGGEMHASLASFQEQLPYNRHALTLIKDDITQQLQADYVIL